MMDMIQKMIRNRCNPLEELGQDLSAEHEDALNRYETAYKAIRQSGIDPELFKSYEEAIMDYTASVRSDYSALRLVMELHFNATSWLEN